MNVRDIYTKCTDVEPKCIIRLFLNDRDYYNEVDPDWVGTMDSLPGSLTKSPVKMFKIKNRGICAVLEETV